MFLTSSSIVVSRPRMVVCYEDGHFVANCWRNKWYKRGARNRCFKTMEVCKRLLHARTQRSPRELLNHPDTENFDNSSFISKSTKFLYCSICSSISWQNSDLNNFVSSFKDPWKPRRSKCRRPRIWLDNENLGRVHRLGGSRKLLPWINEHWICFRQSNVFVFESNFRTIFI